MKMPPAAMLQSFVLGRSELEGSGMAKRASCVVNIGTCFTAKL